MSALWVNGHPLTYDEFKALPEQVEIIETVDPVTHHTVMTRAPIKILLVEAWWRDHEENQVYEIGYYLEDDGIHHEKVWMKRKTNVFDPYPCDCEPETERPSRSHAP